MIIGKNLIKGLGNLMGRGVFYRSQAKNKRDLYQILGVNKTAESNQIKKAYYKLAQEYHPDKNPSSDAKDKFAEINNAYEVLSDPNKRQVYDQTGSTQQDPYQGFNNQDIFNSFKGGFSQQGVNFQDIFGEIFGMGSDSKSKTSNIRETIGLNLQLTFAEAVNGTTKNIQYQKKEVCGSCKGSKAEPGTKPEKCPVCQGRGVMTMRQGPFVMETTCNSCGGLGNKIKHLCKKCTGSGMQNKTTQQTITIPRGIDNGANLRFKGKGNMNGDLVISVKVRKHPKIKREGNDAFSEIQISLPQAVLGASVDIQTIYGSTKKVTIPEGIQSGEKITLAKEGFYVINSSEKGNHLISVKLKTPKKVTEQQKKLYEQLKQFQKQRK